MIRTKNGEEQMTRTREEILAIEAEIQANKAPDPFTVSDADKIKLIAETGTVDEKVLLTQNENVSINVLEKLYDDENVQVRTAAERSNKIPTQKMMERICGVDNYSATTTHSLLLSRDDLSLGDLEKIYESAEDDSTRRRVTEHKNASAELIKRVKAENAEYFDTLA